MYTDRLFRKITCDAFTGISAGRGKTFTFTEGTLDRPKGLLKLHDGDSPATDFIGPLFETFRCEFAGCSIREGRVPAAMWDELILTTSDLEIHKVLSRVKHDTEQWELYLAVNKKLIE